MNLEDSKLQKIQIEVRRLNDVKMGIEKSLKLTENEKASLVVTIDRLRKTEDKLQEDCNKARKELSGLEKQKSVLVGEIASERSKFESERQHLTQDIHLMGIQKKQIEENTALLNGLESEYRKRKQGLEARELELAQNLSKLLQDKEINLALSKKNVDDFKKMQDLRLELAKEEQRLIEIDAKIKEREAAASGKMEEAVGVLAKAQNQLKASESNLTDTQRILAEVKRREAALVENTAKEKNRVELTNAAIEQKRKELELDQLRVNKIVREKDIAKELKEFKEKYG